MPGPDTAPLETLRYQVKHPEPDHLIYNQITERKKTPSITLPDLRKPFLWFVALISLVCLILAIVAGLNPVPVFSSSKGLLSVTAYYPNSTRNTDNDGFNENTSTIPRRTISKRAHDHLADEDEREYDHACDCYRHRTQAVQSPTKKPTGTKYGTTTYLTTTATGLITITPKPTRKPPKNKDDKAEAQHIEVDPGAFAALFLGVSGACLQRRSGVLVCTATSFSPNYLEIYEVAGLAANVTAQLPTGTGGGSIGILVSIISYIFTAIAFIISALPKAWFFGPRGHKAIGASGKLPDLRHQWTLILATGMAAISTFAIVASSIQLQNTFGASAEAVEAWDVTKTLKAKLLDTYGYLYACAILSGSTVVAALSLVAYDFNRPWWMPKAKEEAGIKSQGSMYPIPTHRPVPLRGARSRADDDARTTIDDGATAFT